MEIANQDVSYSPDDPDAYRADAYEIEKLAKKFEVDMSDEIKKLEDKARELEEEQRPDEPDDHEGYGSRGGSDSCSDGDIDSIFSTLNNK